MKLFDNFTKTYRIEDYFFAIYYDNKAKTDVPSFFLRIGKNLAYDIFNKTDLNNVKFSYVKNLTEYHKKFNKYLSLFRAKKLAKKYADIYSDYVIDEINGHVDKFGLKTKVEDKLDLKDAIVLD